MRQKIRKWVSICLCAAVLMTAFSLTADAQSNENQSWLTNLFSLSSENTSAFQTLELREGSLNGTKVVDLLNPSGSWELQSGVDYYLYGEVKKTAGNEYLQIRFGNEDGTYNGATFFNPPGGTYEEGAINHDYFDQLVKYTTFTNPTYGSSNSGKIDLQDGMMLYHIKSDIADNSTVNFAMGLIIQDAVLSGSCTITDAIQVASGSYDSANGTFTAASSKSSDVQLSEKPKVAASFNTTNLMATLDDSSATVQVNIVEADKNKPVEFLYEKLEYDIIYPKNAVWEGMGFSTSFSKTSSSYGTMTVGEPAENGDNYTRHITIGNGYRKKATTLPMYYRLKFTSPDYADGQTAKTSISNMTAVMKDGSSMSITTSSAPATYTILDPSKDSTAVSAINRSEVYNSTISGADTYNVSMGGIVIVNKNVSQPTPREKTYEANFNTTNTAARISVITVPTGTSNTPVVTLTGKTADGSPVTIQVENPANYAYTGTTKKSSVSGATCLRFHVNDFAENGLVTFTSVKAEIGQLRANYKTNSWTANWAYDANNSGAYGYFTTTETGIQVKSTYRIYNTDPNYRDAMAGDLSVTSTATSTTQERTGFIAASTSIKNGSGKTVDSIAAGETVTIGGRVFPYATTGAAKGANGVATTSYVVDPVFFLTLPQGLTYEDLAFSYSGMRSGTLTPLVENISYLNTTGDGVSLYRITFGKGNDFGYYSGDGTYTMIDYSIKLRTSKSMETKRYELNQLIGMSSASQTEAVPYNGNPRTLTTIMTDTYGINGGKNYSGITKGGTTDQPGFGLQQLAEVNVYNAVSVTNINGTPVSGSWNAYDVSNPNSIASLGAKSSGKFRIKIENTSDSPASNLKIMIPIPKAGTDLGNAYMTQAAQFDMKMTFEENAIQEAGFTADYVTATAVDELTGDFSYTKSESDTANAILLTKESLPGKNDEISGGIFEFTFDFTVEGGTAENQNIWRDAFMYTTSDSVTQYKTGSYVASEVAGGTISGTVYRDANRDGVKSAEEIGVSGVTVVAKDADNKILSTTTDSSGYYEFLAVRESETALTFSIAESETLRFNIEADGAAVTPAADGRSAAATVTTAEMTTVDAGVSDYYTLTYHKNSGSGNVPDVQEYVEGAQATVAVKPDNLLRTGYTFQEWNTAADGKGTGYQPGEQFPVNEDTTLYAIWKLGTYKIFFNYRGATERNTVTEKQLVHNQTYNTNGALPVPAKTGYTFKGWCNTSTGTSVNVKDATKFTLGADTTLYALWSAKSGYAVNFATGDNGSEISPISVSWEDFVKPTTEPTRTGYTFAGWKDEAAGVDITEQTTFGELATSDEAGTAVTLTAKWEATTGYTVTYALNQGTGSYDARTVAWDEAGLLPENNPTRQGYAFAGWKLESTDTQITSTDTYGSLAGTEETKGITLTAAWTEIQNNTVHYSTEGGTSYSDKTNVMSSDSNLIPDTEPKRAGYTFAGWDCGENTVTTDTIYSSLTSTNEITLTAVWTAKSYSISYNVSGVSNVVKGWSDTGLIPATNPEKAGSTFAGWYYGNIEVTSATTVLQLIPADQTTTLELKAKWTEQTFTIVYESNGGSSYAPKTAVSYSQTGLLPEVTPVKTGYTFAGWYQGDTQVSEDTSCGSLTAEGNVVTVDAHWTSKTGYRIVYNSAGGTSVGEKTGIRWEDAALIPDSSPSRTGYTFAGWVCGRNSVSNATTYGSLAVSDTADSLTLVAQWTNRTYTVKYDTAGGTAISSKNVGWGSSNLLPVTNPRLEGNSFTGWTYNNSAVTTATLYNELALADDVTEITLTANYEAVENDYDGLGMDVQGKIIETTDTPVYKIDLVWGAMKYDFSIQKGWNPDTHTYSSGTQGHWDAGSFDGKNNCVTVVNHSNSDVSLDFTVLKTATADNPADSSGEEKEDISNISEDPLASVIMRINRTNGDEAESASGILLNKVPAEHAAASQVSTYLRIIGEPDNISILNTNTYEKVGVITVTVEALGGAITPRNP